MRRRLDVTPLPFMQSDGNLFSLTEDGSLISYVPNEVSGFEGNESGGVELSAPTSNVLSSHHDYVSRARYLASGSGGMGIDETILQAPADIKRTINKLSRAVSELRLGILGKQPCFN